MKAIFGTMNLGQQVLGQDAVRMLRTFRDAGGVELDTAYVYNDGACESLLGECFQVIDPGSFSVATKANPRVTGRMDRKSVIDQLNGSLGRMSLPEIDLFFLHFPDKSTPIRSAIEGCAELYSQGKFKELGVSNFPLEMVEEMLFACDELGCPRPTVFEGVYNALSRKVESELLPGLDALGMRFHAYNPLAGGMLTGRYRNVDDKPQDGRFALRAKSYQGRYWKKCYFDAVALISKACEEHGIAVAEAAYRWIANHSMLSERRYDGVIVGASKQGQLEQNIASLSKGPLPREVLEAMEKAWDMTADEAPDYFRFYAEGKAI